MRCQPWMGWDGKDRESEGWDVVEEGWMHVHVHVFVCSCACVCICLVLFSAVFHTQPTQDNAFVARVPGVQNRFTGCVVEISIFERIVCPKSNNQQSTMQQYIHS